MQVTTNIQGLAEGDVMRIKNITLRFVLKTIYAWVTKREMYLDVTNKGV